MAKGMGRGGALSNAERRLAHSLVDDTDGGSSSEESLTGRGAAGQPSAWLRERCERLDRRAATQSAHAAPLPGQPWGWKEPNSHVVLDRLSLRFPRMK